MSDPERDEAAEVDATEAPEAAQSASTEDHGFTNGSEEPTHPTAPAPAADGTIDFVYFGQTDVGLVREHNEDNFLVADLSSGRRGLSGDEVITGSVGELGTIMAVCDGMGGAAAGEVASQMAVDSLYEGMQGEAPNDRDEFARRLVRAVEEAGARIFGAAKMDRTRRGMGTTSTMAGLIDKVLFVGQVGDSRAYVLRNGQLGLITKDQSLVNQLIEAGQLTEEEAEAFEHSNIILQALGTTEKVTVDLTFLELRQGDRVMLCSDGLSGLVHNDALREVLIAETDPVVCCDKLIEMAKAGGGHDNITCVICDFDGDGLAAPDEAPTPNYQQYPLPPGEDEDPEGGTRNGMKSPSAKPGAEVKRPSTITHNAPEPSVPVSTFPWWMVALVGVILMLAGGAALVSRGSRNEVPEAPPVAENGEPAAEATVEVRVRTDVRGASLYVEGRHYGAIHAGEDAFVELEPGIYHFEARVGESVEARTTLTVRPGVPADVHLNLPSAPQREEQENKGPDGEPGAPEGAVPAPSGGEEAPAAPPMAPAAPDAYYQ